jgi:peptide/nickel transport system substrate-binding protein
VSRRTQPKRPTLSAARAVVVLGLATVLTLIMSVAPAFAETASPQESSPAGTSVRIGFPESVDSLNPFAALSGIAWEVFNLGYSQLTTWDEQLKPAPDLATSWAVSSDGKTWTFEIRSGVTWHDGEPLTARDIAFTYNLIKDQQLSSFATVVEPMESVVAPDDTTLVVTCSQPYSGMLALDIPILPEHIWSKVPASELQTWPNKPFVGSGPFEIVEFKRDSIVKLVPYDDYNAGPRPGVDEVDLLMYQTPVSMVMDYQSGALDAITSFPIANLEPVADVPGTRAVAGTFIGFEELGFNCWDSPDSKGNPLLLDKRIRQAVHWAIDKQQLVDQIQSGKAEPATSILSPIMPWHWEPPDEQRVTCDPEKAKQVLDDAGYTDRDGDGVREASDGAKLSFRLTALSEYPELISAAKMIHGWLDDIGIETRIITMAEASFYDVVYGSTDVDMYLWAWGGGADPSLILSAFTTDQIKSWSDCNWSNEQYDGLYKAQTMAVTEEERGRIIDQMQEILYEESPYVVLWYAVRPEAWRTDRFTGWRQVPPETGVPLYNYTRLTYLDLRPASGESPSSGSSVPYWLVAAVVALGAVGVVIWLRRRSGRAETE